MLVKCQLKQLLNGILDVPGGSFNGSRQLVGHGRGCLVQLGADFSGDRHASTRNETKRLNHSLGYRKVTEACFFPRLFTRAHA